MGHATVVRFACLALVVVASLGACTDNTFTVVPVIDEPTNDLASPFPIDSLTVSVAHAGASVDVISSTFPQGATIELSGVPFADDLVMHMTGRLGTSEVSYGRTCKFSLRADARVPEPHLWMSRTVKFGGLTQQPIAREGGLAITYSDGSGLLFGGHPPDADTEAVEQVERFDPNTGTYSTLHDVAKRVGASIALLGDVADTRVVVLGGIETTTGDSAPYVEVIDADTNSEHQYDMFPDTQMGRIGISATSLVDGRVMAIGGKTPSDNTLSGDVVEVAITSGTPVVHKVDRAHLAFPRYLHEATRLNDDLGSPVLITGGLDAMGKPVAEAELFKPLAEDFTAGFNPKMVVPRWKHKAVRLPDGSVLIVGGVDGAGQPVRAIELFSLDTGFVRQATDLPANAGVIDLTATTLPDGRVLLTGGRTAEAGPPVADAFIARLDPLNGNVDVVPTDRLAFARAGHQATLLCDGTVLISGGTGGQSPYERYNPPPAGRR